MKLCEIQHTKRDLRSPFLHVISMNDPLFQEWANLQDEVEDKLMTQYAQQHNIPRQNLQGREYGKLLQATRKYYGTIIDVPLHSLTATESNLESEHVGRLAQSNVRSSSELPIVYKMGRHLIIGDGNHRLAAAIMHGNTAKALVLDLDKLSKL